MRIKLLNKDNQFVIVGDIKKVIISDDDNNEFAFLQDYGNLNKIVYMSKDDKHFKDSVKNLFNDG